MTGGSIEHPVRYKKQNYHKLHKKHQRLKTLFCDPTFPNIDISIGNFMEAPPVEWKRPPDLIPSPRLHIDTKPESIIQGKFSSSWFVSACYILTGIGELYRNVIPDYWKQEWDPEQHERYTGVFHFRFWRYGQWVDVVVDDYLPTFENELLVARTDRKNEFWISLVEKAYAKLHGSYEGMLGGHLSDALVDFTGGVSEVVDLCECAEDIDKQESLLELLMKEINRHSILCVSIAVVGTQQESTRTDVGLYRGHAYGITAVKKVSLRGSTFKKLFMGRDRIPMIRVRDPHGAKDLETIEAKGTEDDDVSVSKSSGVDTEGHSRVGSGASSSKLLHAYSTSYLCRLLSKNQQWAKVRDSERQRIGLMCNHPEEFWMPLEDFVRNFTELVICRMFNTNIFTLSKVWSEDAVRGEWTTGLKDTMSDRAGGSMNFPDTFYRNPQYLFDIKRYEEDLVIQMLQWNTSSLDQVAGIQALLITFYIIKVEENRKYRIHKQWDHNPTVVSLDPVRRREIDYKICLPRGRYIIIPATHKPGDKGGFFLRIFSRHSISLRDIKRDAPRTRFYCCTKGYPIVVTVICIESAEHLKKFSRIGSCDGYCVIKCERKKVKTHIVRNTIQPCWNSYFVFYRCNLEEPVVITVYNHNACLPDNFAGKVILPAPVNDHPTYIRAKLTNSNDDDLAPSQGTLVVQVYTNDNFMTV